MKRRKQPRKPSGIAGVTQISVGPNVVKVDRTRIAFPDNKEELEEFVVRAFERDVKGQPSARSWIGEITRNNENDLDFDVASNGGITKLELTEIVPTPHAELAPEQSVPHLAYERAQAVFQQIMNKSQRYASARPLRIMLLLYVTGDFV